MRQHPPRALGEPVAVVVELHLAAGRTVAKGGEFDHVTVEVNDDGVTINGEERGGPIS